MNISRTIVLVVILFVSPLSISASQTPALTKKLDSQATEGLVAKCKDHITTGIDFVATPINWITTKALKNTRLANSVPTINRAIVISLTAYLLYKVWAARQQEENTDDIFGDDDFTSDQNNYQN